MTISSVKMDITKSSVVLYNFNDGQISALEDRLVSSTVKNSLPKFFALKKVMHLSGDFSAMTTDQVAKVIREATGVLKAERLRQDACNQCLKPLALEKGDTEISAKKINQILTRYGHLRGNRSDLTQNVDRAIQSYLAVKQETGLSITGIIDEK
jgi:uncharacterized protein YgbK (DUF1537 family)